MKKIIIGLAATILIGSGMLFAKNELTKSDCCETGSTCCFPGSACCVKK